MKIREAIIGRAISAIGGRNSKAYTDYEICEWVIADIEMTLEREFGVCHIAEIPNAECAKAINWEVHAMNVIEEYELPLCLAKRITYINLGGI